LTVPTTTTIARRMQAPSPQSALAPLSFKKALLTLSMPCFLTPLSVAARIGRLFPRAKAQREETNATFFVDTFAPSSQSVIFFRLFVMLNESSPFLGLLPEPLLPSPPPQHHQQHPAVLHQHDPALSPPPPASSTAEGALVLLVARSRVGRVIGRAGDTIKSLQTYSGAAIQIDQSCDPTRVVLAGADGAVRLAASMVG
jgi:hypothetical protein